MDANDKPTRDLAVIGASAGGVHALRRLVATLSPDHAGTLLVVVHIGPESPYVLPDILDQAGPLPAVRAVDRMPLRSGEIVVARPDHHLLVERGQLRVLRGPRENRHRPAIDPLFRSAAWTYGPRVVGVILSGDLDDGTAGLWAVKSCGGTTVVQEPEEAEHPDMPANALMHNRIDHRLPLARIGPLLGQLARAPIEPAAVAASPPPTLADEIGFVEMTLQDIKSAREAFGTPSAFTCPSCGGALWELDEGGHLRYRCHTGHAFTHANLLAEQDLSLEQNLYAALRAVEEKAATLRRMAERWPPGTSNLGQEYEDRAKELDRSADTLKKLLSGNGSARVAPTTVAIENDSH